MIAYLKIFLALLYAAALVAYPVHALAGAQAGMRMWAMSVAPALLPFAAVMPYLTCREARLIYDKLFGRMVRFLFDLPGGTASAVATGLAAGSPAGALAVARVAVAEKLTAGQAARLAGMCCGVSPVYALSVMGVAVYGSADIGWRFVLSQISAQLLTGIVFRKAFEGDKRLTEGCVFNEEKPIAGAVAAVLRVGGYMTVFSAGLWLARECAGEHVLYVSPFMDLPSGIDVILLKGWPLWIAAGALGFGGLCIGFQNVGILKAIGVKPVNYFLQKLVCGILCAVVFVMLGYVSEPAATSVYVKKVDIYDSAMLVLSIMLVPTTVFFMKKGLKNIYLNK